MVFFETFSEGFRKLQSTCPEEQFEEKQFFEKRTYFCPFWDTEQTVFGVFDKVLPELRKLHSTCPEEQFEENYAFWKKCILYSLSHIETKIFGLLSEKIRRYRQNSILRFHKNTLKKTFFSEKNENFK